MSNRLSIKSKFFVEFRRFSLNLKKTLKFNEFKSELEQLHGLQQIPFFIYYIDPLHGDLLPINNDDNFALAINLPNVNCLKLHLQTKDESWSQNNGSVKKKNFFENITNNLLPLHSGTLDKSRKLHISFPEDFRQVSSIIDVDILPATCRRVRLVKHGSDKPLGFYIRDGTSVRATVKGLEKVPGIFISRMVPGGLAESTGLLAVNDEVLEVNGIEVLGKTLDQVTDMMVANSSNLIITIRPANQRSSFNHPKQDLTLKPSQLMSQSISHHSMSKSSSQQSQSQKLTSNQAQKVSQNVQQKNQQHNHGSHKINPNNNHGKIPYSKSENNLHLAHRSNHQNSSQQSSTHLKPQLSNQQHNNVKSNLNQRIPLQTNDNTLSSTYPQQSDSPLNKPSYYYLDSFVKLAPEAPGEDTDDEDEVKEYTDGIKNQQIISTNNKDSKKPIQYNQNITHQIKDDKNKNENNSNQCNKGAVD